MILRWLTARLGIPAWRTSPSTGRRQIQTPRTSRNRALRVEWLESRQLLSTLPAGFQETLIATGLNPTSQDFAPDGRLFVCNKGGTITIIQSDGTPLATPFYSVAVDNYRDRGLDAIVFDPNFAQNHYVYIYYTAAVPSNPDVADNGADTKLVRITASATDPNVADPSSAVVLLDNIPSPSGNLFGGFLHFGADGMLYVGVGSQDAPLSAQDLSTIYGKILRLDVRNYPNMIPPDNPFVGQAGKRGEIWAYGFRNPFSGNIEPGTNNVLVNDVGSDLWEEVDRLVKGGNYGWPLAEGMSANPDFINPLYTYSHNGGGAAVVGGAFYNGVMFPSEYLGQYFVADLVAGVIRVLDPSTGQVFDWATNLLLPTDQDVAPDGSLYWTSIGDGAVYRIAFSGGADRAPTAIATSDVTDGLAPLTVNFSGAGSFDPDADPLTYSWDFGDGTTGSGVTAQHTYTVNGSYNAVLTVSDRPTDGLTSTTLPIVITVGNRAPQPTITTPLSTDKYVAGQTITFAGTATDPDDGTVPPSAFHWSFVFGHNTHFHDFIAPIDGATSGSFVADVDEVDPDQYYRISLTVTDSGGLKKTTFRDIRPVTSTFTLASNVPGASLLLDSQPKITPLPVLGVVGMTRTIEAPATQLIGDVTYRFVGWSDGGAAQHQITTPAVATTFTAQYEPLSLAAGFDQVVVAGGLYEPTAMVVAPDGRIFVTEKPFGVRVIQNGQLLGTPFVQLSVERDGERGVLGIALDPGFAQNGFVYVYYTHHQANNAFIRLSRFTVSSTDPNVADPASELPLIDGIPTVTPGWYNGGFLQFGADGMLYVGIGDTMDTTLPQDLSKLQGKILRINPAAYPNLIPSDNPFVGTPGARGEIWALGFHNPATGTVLPGTSRIFVNDLGNGGYSEVNEVVRGGNYGWPLAEGPSGNAALRDPTYGYPAENNQPAVLKGSVFYSGANFPAAYAGKYFFGDFIRGYLRALDMPSGVATPIEDDIVAPIDLENSPDGNLYWLSQGGPAGIPPGAIYKIRYGANRPPVAVASANPTAGQAPLTVSFSGAGSSDPDGDPLTYSWNFGDGTIASGVTVQHTYSVDGSYNAVLTVSDLPFGGLSSTATPIVISVGNGFVQDLIAGGLYEPTAMAVAPDGRIFVTEKPYGVRVVAGGQLLATPFVSLPVEREGERGVQSIALDPGFAQNGFVYVYYTHLTATGSFNRLSRFKTSSTNPNVADPASELPLIDGIPTVSPGWYNGGLLQFGADGMLYVGIGDTMDPSLPQDLSKLQGKILRINPAAYPNLIPGDNPFVGTAGARGEIWALGFHNPATGAMLPGTSRLFVNDLGTGTYSEVDEVVRGGNYGWPLAEGPTSIAGLVNPTYGYPNTDTQPAVLKGSVFYAGASFPAGYAGQYFLGDFVRGDIRTLDLPTGASAPFADGILAPIDIDNSPDGNLYLLSQGSPAAVIPGGIYKIRYGANRPPVAVATANPTAGPAPLTVNFDGSASTDPDGNSLVMTWDFGDGQTGSGATATHTYATSGTYFAKLTASDGLLSSSSAPLTISVANQPPVPAILLPGAGATYRGGQQIALSGAATDPGYGSLPASALEWKVDFFHDGQVQSFINSIPGVATSSFTVPLTGENSPNQWYRVYLTATDSSGLKATTFTDVVPQLSTFTLATNPAGGSLLLDGQPVSSPATITGVVGMSRTISAPAMQLFGGGMYKFVSWSDGGAATHTISTPTAATTYVAQYQSMPLAATYTSNAPRDWVAGKTFTYQVTVTNVGTQTWPYSGTTRVRLGVYFGGDSDAVGAWSKDPTRFALTRNIAPGQSFTFSVKMTAPTTPGAYILRHRMVKESVAWFDTMEKINVSVGTLAATYAGTPPTIWGTGQPQRYSITVNNTGSATWRAIGTDRVRLGVWFGGSSDTPPTGSSAPVRYDLPYDVAPGGSATVTIDVTAPATAGSYTLRHRLVHEWAGWFSTMLKTAAAVEVLAAQYTVTPPTQWRTDELKTYSITLKNTGTNTWNATGAFPVNLGVYFAGASDAAGAWDTEPLRFSLPRDVLPGQSITLTISVRAPSLAGSYVLRHRMVKEFVNWFNPLHKVTVSVLA